MSKHLERDLDALQKGLLAQAAAVEDAIQKAIRALQTRDAVLATEVAEGDDRIDEEETQIEEQCLKLLALHQPVAGDLRRITAVLLLNVELERMGDLAEQIAVRAADLTQRTLCETPSRLQAMTDLTTAMVRQALDSFVKEDVRLARQVCRLDDEVDRLNVECIRELTACMQNGPDRVDAGLSLFTAVRHLERIADHATNIAEDVIYLVEGEIVRHRPESRAPRDASR